VPALSKRLRDIAFAVGLFILLLAFFWPVTAGNATMIPADVLYQHQPWKGSAGLSGPVTPQNGLVADLIYENYVWKQFILQSLKAGQLPLWNPHVLSGVAFLAAGQHSALYPFSLLFYILPLTRAYGLFTISQLWLAGLCLYYLLRTLRLSRFASAVGGLIFAFSGFMLVSQVFPMILAAAAWLPFLLAITERMLQAALPPEKEEQISTGKEGEPALNVPLQNGTQETTWQTRIRAPLPWLILGSLGLGMQFLAGHPEIAYYNLLVLGAYATWRAVAEFAPQLRRRWRTLVFFAGLMVAMVILGSGLGAVQFIPLYEATSQNFRQGSQPYQQIVSYAYPARRLLAFLIPNFFGSPAEHSYVDLYTGQTLPTLRDALGSLKSTEWGIKNYVEGTAYVSLLGLLLAFFGVLRRPRKQAWFFIALGLFSLTLVFGMPTYRLIFALPGINQLHSPFRWVFPYTVCLAVLAGLGAESLLQDLRTPGRLRLPAIIGALTALAGVATAALVLVMRAFPQHVLPLADKLLAHLAKAPEAFSDGRMFISYEAHNLLIFAACLLASGLALLAFRLLPRQRPIWRPFWMLAVLAVIALDASIWLRPFTPVVDPAPLTQKPPAIAFLQQDKEPFRITVYDTKSTKALPANTAMLFGLDDIRGYDSIIPKWYAEVMSLVGPQELEYNQIARLTQPQSLDSPILDLLNVRYVLTEETINRPNYTLVYDKELRIYRNDDALPRAFVVFQARTLPRDQLLAELPKLDPRSQVLLEQAPPQSYAPTSAMLKAPPVEFRENAANEVQLHVNMPAPGFLVLADDYAPGWVAYTTLDGQTEEQPLTVMRADGTVRAVQLPAGPQTIRFKYSPTSLKIGLFVSFMAAVSLILIAALWLWLRFNTSAKQEETARRVAKNTVGPFSFQMLNKVIDMAFMMLALRLLGPDNAGKYYFAIVVYGWFEILTNFGLNTLLTREVARNRADANRYLWNTTVLRLGMAGLAAPLLVVFLLVWRPMPHDTALAIILFMIGLVPASISTGLSAVFSAFEVMSLPAAVSTVTTLCKDALGTGALLLGWGFVGLAGVSIVVNTITMLILFSLLMVLFFRPHPHSEPTLRRAMVHESFPLMINHLLATLFFKVDVLLLENLKGDAVVGWYSTSYKFVDTVGIIPPVFTMAIFPLISRLAASARDSLLRAYILSIKLLVSIALLLAMMISALAYPLVMVFGGAAYLPHSARALEIMIWYMPIGFINSLTQYVLIALDQQRFLTRAFVIALVFNLGANLLLIPRYSYQAAAAITIASEVALLIPFYVGIRRYLARITWVRTLWRPVLSAAVAEGILWILRHQPRLPVAILAAVAYIILVLALGTFDAQDREFLRQVLPVDRLWQRLLRRQPSEVNPAG